MDGIIRPIFAQLGYEAPVVATGGLASRVAAQSQTITAINPELTLEGLRPRVRSAGRRRQRLKARDALPYPVSRRAVSPTQLLQTIIDAGSSRRVRCDGGFDVARRSFMRRGPICRNVGFLALLEECFSFPLRSAGRIASIRKAAPSAMSGRERKEGPDVLSDIEIAQAAKPQHYQRDRRRRACRSRISSCTVRTRRRWTTTCSPTRSTRPASSSW